MAHRWVLRKHAYTRASVPMAHLVKKSGVIWGLPALCGEVPAEHEYWLKADRKVVICTKCKAFLARR